MTVPTPEEIHLDCALLVINKPAGLLTLPDGYDQEKPHMRGFLEAEYGRLWTVHRLDKETSGVIVFARDKNAHKVLNTQFSERKVEKRYLAVLVGAAHWDEVEINYSLLVNVGRRKRTVVDNMKGKPAKTYIRVIERFDKNTLIEAHPTTGRTHQIRAHLFSIGYPILADPLYGDQQPSSLINRLALHAKSLTLIHPNSGKLATFTAPEPQDFKNGLIKLRS